MEKEEILKKELRENWINCFVLYLTNNLAALEKCYGKNLTMSYNDVFRLNQESFMFTEKEKEEVLKNVEVLLNETYLLKINANIENMIIFNKQEEKEVEA